MAFNRLRALLTQRDRRAVTAPAIRLAIAAPADERAVTSVPTVPAMVPVADRAAARVARLGAVPDMPNDMSSDNGISEMLNKLHAFLPQAADGNLPAPSVTVFSLTERPVGIGGRRGEDLRAGFNVVALKGNRLETMVRFQLWSDQLPAVEQAIQDLNTRLLSSRDELRSEGFLEFSLQNIAASENVPNLGFRDAVEYRVLYEHQFEDNDGADSILATIPVLINSVYNQATIVTDGMARWDNQSAAALSLRGPLTLGGLTAIVLLQAPEPSGNVLLTRTFDGAAAAPTAEPDLATFLAAVSGSQPASVNAQVAFPSVTDFVAAFQSSDDPVTLGTNTYAARELTFQHPVLLPRVTDLFEVSYENPPFDHPSPSVVYLRSVSG